MHINNQNQLYTDDFINTLKSSVYGICNLNTLNSDMVSLLSEKISEIYGNDYFKKMAGIETESLFNTSLKLFGDLSYSIDNYKNTFSSITTNSEVNNYFSYLTTNFQDIIKNNLDKIYNYKYIEYINLCTHITTNYINDLNKLQSKVSSLVEGLTNFNIDKTDNFLTSQLNAIPKFISYAYSKKSIISLDDAYDSSKIKQISDLGDKIINLFIDIGDLYSFMHDGDLFIHDDGQDLARLAVNIKNVADTKDKYNLLITLLFKGIFEPTLYSRGVSRLYDLLNEYNIDSFGLDLIKWNRTLCQHSTDKTDTKKIKKVYEFNINVIKKKKGEKPSDFVDLQLALYNKIYEMLNELFTAMNNK